MVDTVMCTKELCPCSSEFKQKWNWMNDEDFKKSGRAVSLDKMSQEEKDAYEKDGVNAKVIPLYFTDEGTTYSNFADCFSENIEKIKDAKPYNKHYYDPNFDF